MQHLVKDSYRPHHAHLHLNNLVTGRFLSNTPTKFMGDSTMDQPSENRIPRPQMDLPTKGHNNTKSWALNGQATDRSALGQTDIFPNKVRIQL